MSDWIATLCVVISYIARKYLCLDTKTLAGLRTFHIILDLNNRSYQKEQLATEFDNVSIDARAGYNSISDLEESEKIDSANLSIPMRNFVNITLLAMQVQSLQNLSVTLVFIDNPGITTAIWCWNNTFYKWEDMNN